MSGAPPALAECDSFPKLLRRNAAVRGALADVSLAKIAGSAPAQKELA